MKSCRCKTKCSVSSGFLLTVAAIIYMDGFDLVSRCIFACLLHETGHWVTIRRLGGNVQAVRITAIGAEMSIDTRNPLSYEREIAVALAGPTVSLVVAWIAARFGWFLFAGMNFSLGLLNLIPIVPLDGGRVLQQILCRFCPDKVESILRWTSIVFAGLVLGLGAAAWQRWGNITLLMAALWLLYEAIK